MDLIYGVPGQSIAELRHDLSRAADTGATHVSCLRLEIIPFTALKLREGAGLLPERISQEMLDEMDDVVLEVLSANGYQQYGAFSFAKPGYESVHNHNAFMDPKGQYIGFGNSSFSYINGFVYSNHAEVQDYKDAVFAGRDPNRSCGASQRDGRDVTLLCPRVEVSRCLAD